MVSHPLMEWLEIADIAIFTSSWFTCTIMKKVHPNLSSRVTAEFCNTHFSHVAYLPSVFILGAWNIFGVFCQQESPIMFSFYFNFSQWAMNSSALLDLLKYYPGFLTYLFKCLLCLTHTANQFRSMNEWMWMGGKEKRAINKVNMDIC